MAKESAGCCCGTCIQCGIRLLPTEFETSDGFIIHPGGLPCRFGIRVILTCLSEGFDDRICGLTGVLEAFSVGSWSTEVVGKLFNECGVNSGASEIDFGLFCDFEGRWFITGGSVGPALEAAPEQCFDFTVEVTDEVNDCFPNDILFIDITFCGTSSGPPCAQNNPEFLCDVAGINVCDCDDDGVWTRTNPAEESSCVDPLDPPPGNCDPCEVDPCCCDVCVRVVVFELEGTSSEAVGTGTCGA